MSDDAYENQRQSYERRKKKLILFFFLACQLTLPFDQNHLFKSNMTLFQGRLTISIKENV
jgi:hypothetical protein